jgi:hypothetical protein
MCTWYRNQYIHIHIYINTDDIKMRSQYYRPAHSHLVGESEKVHIFLNICKGVKILQNLFYKFISVYVYIHTCIRIYQYIHTYIYIFIYSFIYMFMYSCTHTCRINWIRSILIKEGRFSHRPVRILLVRSCVHVFAFMYLYKFIGLYST